MKRLLEEQEASAVMEAAARAPGEAETVSLCYRRRSPARRWNVRYTRVLQPLTVNFNILARVASHVIEVMVVKNHLRKRSSAGLSCRARHARAIAQPSGVPRGLVRHCHGDQHLRNIALLDGRPTLFDGVEFNDERLFGLSPLDRLGPEGYSSEMSERV